MYKEIKRQIRDKEAQEEIRRLFDEEKPDEMLDYIEVYATSVESPDEKDKRSKNARELYKYLSNNREGLLPYDKQGKSIPDHPCTDQWFLLIPCFPCGITLWPGYWLRFPTSASFGSSSSG